MQYIAHSKQTTKIEERQVDPALANILKKMGVMVAIVGVAIGVRFGVHSVITEPEFVPEQTPQSIELQEDINNAESFDEVVDAINENKAQQIESGVATHPKYVIEDHNQKVEEAKDERKQKEEQMQALREETAENNNMSESMQNFVNEENKQKVIKIENKMTIHPEHVIPENNAIGGKSL